MRKEKINYRTGTHLMLSGKKCDVVKLEDKTFILTSLADLIKKLGNKPLQEPCAFNYQDPQGKGSGLSVIQLMSDSHLALHTFPDSAEFFAEVFSCGEFDSTLVTTTVNSWFAPETHHVELISQGTELPSQIKLAGNLELEERDRVLTSL